MTFTLPPLPTVNIPQIAMGDPGLSTFNVLQAKYTDATHWAGWATEVLNQSLTDLSTKLGADDIAALIANLDAKLGAIPDPPPLIYTPSVSEFTSSLLTAAQNRLVTDLAAGSTGLGAAAEAAIFGRETARAQAVTAKAYSEITENFSSRGFDLPPGALGAKQTEASAETAQLLTDSSGKITEESARLALDYNKHVISTSIQLIDIVAKLFDSKEMRAFEAQKTTATLALEAYKAALDGIRTRADILMKEGDMNIAALARRVDIEAQSVQGVAQGAMQMIASALNGVSVGSSYTHSSSFAA